MNFSGWILERLSLDDCGLFLIWFLLFRDGHAVDVNNCPAVWLDLSIFSFCFLPQADVFSCVLLLTLIQIAWFIVLNFVWTFLDQFCWATVICFLRIIDLQLLRRLIRNSHLFCFFVVVCSTEAALTSIRRLAVFVIGRFAAASVSLPHPIRLRIIWHSAQIYLLKRQSFSAFFYRRVLDLKPFLTHRFLMVRSVLILKWLIFFDFRTTAHILHR